MKIMQSPVERNEKKRHFPQIFLFQKNLIETRDGRFELDENHAKRNSKQDDLDHLKIVYGIVCTHRAIKSKAINVIKCVLQNDPR